MLKFDSTVFEEWRLGKEGSSLWEQQAEERESPSGGQWVLLLPQKLPQFDKKYQKSYT